MKRYLIVDLIHVFIMISDSEHPFTCLLAIYISSLEKCLFKSFLIGMFFVAVVVLSCRNCLNLPLSDTLFENIFSHSMCCLFTLLTVTFDTHVFNFNEMNLFLILSVFLVSYLRNHSPISRHEALRLISSLLREYGFKEQISVGSKNSI